MSRNWDDYTFDEDGNPEYLGPPKEEPDCPPCYDSGVVPPYGLLRRTNCPSCAPTRLQHYLFRLRWSKPVATLVAVVRAVRPRHRPGPYADEAPF